MKDFQKFLQDNNACQPAVAWVAGRPLTAELIHACPKKTWLGWLATRVPVDHHLLAELGKDSEGYVREAVANRIPVDHPLFSELGKDEQGDVREAVAKRIPVDHPLFFELGKDSYRYVRAAVAKRLKDTSK